MRLKLCNYRKIVFMALMSLLSACETVVGVSYEASLEKTPDYRCILEAAEKTPGVFSVSEIAVTSRNRSFAKKALFPMLAIQVLPGDEGEDGFSLLVSSAKKEEIKLNMLLIRTNRIPSKELVDATLSVMVSLKHRLQTECDIPGSNFELSCFKVNCP